MDKKITLGACQLLGGKLVCWSAKKQQSVAMSSAETEYVVVAGCCANILWVKNQLTDYDIIYEEHIDIRCHFIRDHVLKGDIELHFIPAQYQLADIFTKPLDNPTFKRVIVELGGSHSQAKEKIVPYPRFISLLLEHMAPKYDNEELTINPTQVFSVHNWILKPNQPKEPPFTDYIKAICNLDVHVDSKAPKYSSPIKEASKSQSEHSKKETKSSSAMDTSPSHPSPPTPVVGEMHKEA
nr:hypothetical protein [Tanacetum cinerariifolium]